MNNGGGSWDKYIGSQLEADVVSFIETELQNHSDLSNVSDSVFCFDRAAGVSTCKKLCKWCSENQDFEENER